MSKIILDLCGGTGAWSRPYRDAGYDVRVITLPGFDIIKTRIGNDWMAFLSPKEEWTKIMTKEVHGILAAPPCTMFSLARMNAKTPRDFVGAMKIVQSCLEVIWACRISGGLKWWALENPRGYLRQFLGSPPFTFEHWQFDKESRQCKPTDIWGFYDTPKPSVKEKPIMLDRNMRTNNLQKPLPPKGYEHLTDRAAIRSITPSGFAQAFFKANP